jgi:hypothetical protein
VTAPIFLNRPEARRQYKLRGLLCTLRKRRGEGRTRARSGSLFKFEDLGPVLVIKIKERPSDEFLGRFVEFSGFDALAKWKAAAEPGANVLYYVFALERP